MAGGPSTPQLAAAVSEAGGLGFLAAGYKAPDAVREDLRAARALTGRPLGLNLLYVVERPVDDAAIERYARSLAGEADRLGVALGTPRFDDDHRAEKLALAAEERVPVVSFAFACPTPDEVDALHAAGADVWVTVTEPAEALEAADAGAGALVVQGVEAGGHRGTFDDADATGEIGLLALLRLVATETPLPLVAAGGIMDREGVAAVLQAGAVAAQLGTAFMLCPEAGTSPAHRAAFRTATGTALTRAFTGRRARGLVNRFLREHDAAAPAAYPHVHALTAPLRAAARAAGDADAMHLWAGQGFRLAREVPAARLVAELSG
jgi:nitronate monooxygenase